MHFVITVKTQQYISVQFENIYWPKEWTVETA